MLPTLLTVGPLTFKTYGFFVALGALAAFRVLGQENERLKLSPGVSEHLFAITVGLGLLGSRILYAITYQITWQEFFRIWEGGLSFMGGLVAATAGVVLYARVHSLSIADITDMVVLALPLGHAIGRIGCLAAGCCWGLPTTSSLSIVFTNPNCFVPKEFLGQKLYPTQIYEAMGLFILFLILQRLKYRFPGRLAGLYLIGYALLRSSLEFIRGETIHNPHLGNFTLIQTALIVLAIPMAILWIFLGPSRLKK